jgi:hypothetical protein
LWWETIRDLVKENLQAKCFRFDKNYGKAKVVNSLVNDYNKENPNTLFLFSMDSDMLFLTYQMHFFDRLFVAAKMLQEKSQDLFRAPKAFGMVALNQAGECCHWHDPKPGYTGMDCKATYEIKDVSGKQLIEEIVWPSDGCGIAGGGIFVNLKLWNAIGGYRNFNTQYAGDDGLLLRDIQQAGASVCIIKTLSLTHPTPEDDPEYRKWKDECMKSAFDKYDDEKFKKSVEDSENLWNK